MKIASPPLTRLRVSEYCGTMKNITVSVDEETYRRARMKAAERDTSVSALVRQFLTDLRRKKATRTPASSGAELARAGYQLQARLIACRAMNCTIAPMTAGAFSTPTFCSTRSATIPRERRNATSRSACWSSTTMAFRASPPGILRASDACDAARSIVPRDRRRSGADMAPAPSCPGRHRFDSKQRTGHQDGTPAVLLGRRHRRSRAGTRVPRGAVGRHVARSRRSRAS